MENVFGWLLPDHDRLAGWMVREVTGAGRMGLFIMEKELGLPQSDPIDNFNMLLRTEPDEVRNALSEFEMWYNQNLQEFESRYPKTCKMIWLIYRTSSAIARSRTLSGKIDYEGISDAAFAVLYECMVGYGEEPGDSIDVENLRLVEMDPDYMGGVGKYKFMAGAGKVRTEIWDLRKDEIPWFEYTKQGS